MTNIQVFVSIQLLRAIAVLSVVYSHNITAGAKFPKAGDTGVDIFFIISGFVIAYVVSKSTDNFFVKRLIKIMPMYVLAVIATVLAAIIFPNAVYSTTISGSDFFRSILFIPSVENNGHPSILPQGWTLYYEIFFYVAMSLCILFVKNRKYLTFSCIFIIAFVIAMMNLMCIEDSILNFYCGELSFEFISGIILYHLYCYFNQKTTNQKAKIVILSFLGIASYGFLIFSQIYDFSLSSYRSINWGIPAFIFVSSMLFLENNIKDIKILRIVSMKIGNASYIMYLVHFHVQAFFIRIVFSKIAAFHGSFIIEIVKFLLTSAIIIAISIAMHKFIEKPIQNYFRKKLEIAKTFSQVQQNI
jgi:peptidoglycan/LPS O-acetylase OafA/YrhL